MSDEMPPDWPGQMIGLAAFLAALTGALHVSGVLSEEQVDEITTIADQMAADSGGGPEAARAILAVRTLSAGVTGASGDDGV